MMQVYLFGILKERLGALNVPVDIDLPGSVAAVDQAFRAAYPAVAEIPFQVAVNHFYATPETLIQSGDHVALLPPVSGG